MNKIMVGLDLTPNDQKILTYTKYLNTLLSTKNIHFVHAEREVELAKELTDKFPELITKVDEVMLDSLKKEINETEFPNTHIDVDIYHGKASDAILEHAKKDDFELLVLGKNENSHSIEKKIAKKIPTNIWYVPQSKHQEIKTILVPVDFSEDSTYALETAIGIAEKSNATVTCQNVYKVPVGFNKTGKSFKEFSEIMKGHALNDYKQLIEKIDTKGVVLTDPILSLNNDEIIGDLILNQAKAKDFSLIVVGARGRTQLASLFIGSVAERLVESNLPCPLLLTKKDRNSLLSLWNSIMD